MGNYNWHTESSNLKRKKYKTDNEKMKGDSVAETPTIMITKGESTIHVVKNTVNRRLTMFCTMSYVSRPQYIRPSTPIRTYVAEDVFELQKYHDQDLTHDHLAEIRKQSTLEEAEEPKPQPKERTMSVTVLSLRLGLTGAGIKLFEDNDSNT